MFWNADKNRADREALEATTPTSNKKGPWYKDPGLRSLNFGLVFLLCGDVAHGYDGSLINNLQQLHKWQEGKCSPSK
jgi:hypothetical protein